MGGSYHVLNRGNGHAEIFHKPEDYAAFDRILAEGLATNSLKLFCFQLRPNDWNRVLQPAVDEGFSRFMRWINANHTRRNRADCCTYGQGHVDQDRFKTSRFQMKPIFSRSVATRNETPCLTASNGGRKTGDRTHCGGGRRPLNLIRYCYRLGQFLAYLIGSLE